jgi:glycerol-3-phosphate acyltransferase PlsY
MLYLYTISAMFLSYLAGSFPSSIVIGKVFFKTDIRKHGSGNAGGTNSIRTFGLPAGIAVIVLDIGKGVLSVLLISRLASDHGVSASLAKVLCGFSAVAGHIWTIFAGFKGGKGVATAAGMIFSTFPITAPMIIPFALIILFTTGYVSLASILSSIIFPFIVLVFYLLKLDGDIYLVLGSLFFPVVIIYTHRSNLNRLVKGVENRFEKIMIFKPKGVQK